MSTENIWVIGDVQGCAHSLSQLLQQPELDQPQARFVFVGDLVNRGPDSAGVLRLIRDLGPRARTVLGNHDIHLLGVAAGVRKQSASDTLGSVLQAPDSQTLIDWLRQQPLALHLAGHLIVHAGLHPSWKLRTVLKLAKQVQTTLQAKDWKTRIGDLFGNKPDRWSKELEGLDLQRYTVNVLTRLRHFDANGRIDTKYKGAPKHGSGVTPWFAMPERRIEMPVVFGHWSTLGLYLQADVIGIDTGCLWGGQLTAIRLSDRKIVQVPNSDGELQPF
ncbi:MAG TPA: symmetrical bis(5'-nucleosyl)-tetraphosphatase [Alcaligenaceae bacterium]|nr:symmetrical bis(5'-nucleosyl)-tetraphosphatase [Alcaligenaceae bacterium]